MTNSVTLIVWLHHLATLKLSACLMFQGFIPRRSGILDELNSRVTCFVVVDDGAECRLLTFSPPFVLDEDNDKGNAFWKIDVNLRMCLKCFPPSRYKKYYAAGLYNA